MTKKKEKEDVSDMSVDELIDKWKQIKELLKTLEDDYRKAEISESAYKEAKQKNERKFKQFTEILAGWGITEDQIDAKPAAEGAEEVGAAKDEKTADSAEPADSAAEPNEPQKGPVPGQTNATVPSQGTAAAQPLPATQPTFSMDVIESKMDARLEKLNANIETLKETNSGLSERMQTINESIGELRSQGAQRESSIKDSQSRLETLNEEVSAINPEKYSKALEKRDKTASKQDMRIEKLEMKTSEIAKTTGDIRKLLESIGGLENVASVSKDIGKKMNQVSQSYNDIQKLSNRTEKMYVQLNKRMENFAVYQSKQENVEGVVKDIIKSVDAISMRLDDYVTITNFDALKKSISDLEIKIGSLQEMISKVIPIARVKIPQPIRDLQDQKEAIQSIMESLDEEYNEGKIKRESYERVKKKNISKMGAIEAALKKEWSRFENIVGGPKKTREPGAEKGSGSTPAETAGSNEGKAEKTVEQPQEKTGGGAIEAKKPPINPSKPGQKTAAVKAKPKEAVASAPVKTNTKKMPQRPPAKAEISEVSKSMAGIKRMELGVRTDGKNKKIQATKQQPTKPVKKAAVKPVTKSSENTSKPAKSSENDSMLSALEDSYKKGLLSKDVYESTKKMLKSKK